MALLKESIRRVTVVDASLKALTRVTGVRLLAHNVETTGPALYEVDFSLVVLEVETHAGGKGGACQRLNSVVCMYRYRAIVL